MKLEISNGIAGERIHIHTDSGEIIKFTAKELVVLKRFSDSLFGENPTHKYIKNSDYDNLKRIKEIGIELLTACKKTQETNSPIHVIQKFHEFQTAIFEREETS